MLRDHWNDRAQDEVPVLIERDGDNGLNVKSKFITVVGRAIAEVLIRLKWNADQRRDWIGKFLGQFGRFIGLGFDLRRISSVEFSKAEEQASQSRIRHAIIFIRRTLKNFRAAENRTLVLWRQNKISPTTYCRDFLSPARLMRSRLLQADWLSQVTLSLKCGYGVLLEYALDVLEPSRACRTDCIRTSSSKGLARKPKAPASSAVWRTDGSSRPLMKIIRVFGETSPRKACTSNPFMSGIHTSRTATRHFAWRSLARKAPGWLNFSTLKPADMSKRPSAFSMEASSSRSQTGWSAKTPTGEACVPDSSRWFNEEFNTCM